MAMAAVVVDLLTVADGWGDMSGELLALLVTLNAETKLCAIGCCGAGHDQKPPHWKTKHILWDERLTLWSVLR